MILQIPVDSNNYEEAIITSFNQKKYWLIVELEDGYTRRHDFYDDACKIDDIVDFLIVNNKEEEVDEFLDEGIDILIAPLQKYAQDVVEAYVFRELHEF